VTYGPAALRNTDEPGLAPSTAGSPRIAMAAEMADGSFFTLAGKLIDGSYPDYSRVVPGQGNVAAPEHRVTVQRANMVHALHALTPFASEMTRSIKLRFAPGEIILELKNLYIGTGAYPIPATHGIGTDALSIAFNGRYLMDMLKAFHGEDLQIGLTNEASPALFIDPADTAFCGVLMPIRI